jgi:CHAD domain-containing protein
MTLLEQQMRGLTEDLSAIVSKLADEATPKSVHRLRTTIRRIETLVSYANPDIGKKLERSLEKLESLRKRAGKVRDIDVQKKLLDRVGNGSTAKDRKTLSALLDKKRGRQATRLQSAIKKVLESKFISRMERIAEKIAGGPSGANRPLAPLEEARLQLARIAEDFSLRQSVKPNRLHNARVQLKKVRYLAELAEESAERKVFIDELKKVQDTVGEWHDWQELAQLAEKRFSDRVNCALLREVRALFSARQSAAVSAMNRLFISQSTRKPPRSVRTQHSVARQA